MTAKNQTAAPSSVTTTTQRRLLRQIAEAPGGASSDVFASANPRATERALIKFQIGA